MDLREIRMNQLDKGNVVSVFQRPDRRLIMLFMGILVFPFMLFYSSLSQADVFEDGLNAFGKAKYDKAFTLWKPLAEKGNAAAQYYVGIMYQNGQGVKKDYVLAYAWYSVAADEQDMAEENRDDIVVKMSGSEVKKAEKLAKEYTIRYSKR